MPEYLSPGIYVEEFDSGATPMQGVSTSVAGFVGLAEKGPVIGAPVLVTSVADFSRKFGGYLQTSEFGEYRFLAHAVNHFFINGGSKLFISRVAPPDAQSASIASSDGKSMKIEAKNPGVWGNSISVYFEPTNENRNQIMKDFESGKYKLKNSFGFDAGDIICIEGLKDVQYARIINVQQNTITLNAPLKGKVVDTDLLPKVVIKTCEFNMIIECDGEVEKYENLSFNLNSPKYIEKALSKSEFINLSVTAPKDIMAPFEYLKKLFNMPKNENIKVSLAKGSNGTVAKLSDGDFIGKDEGPGARTGIQSFLDNTNVNILAVPGITSANVQLSLVAQCENLGSRFAILDVPLKARTTTDVLKHRDIVDSDYCAMYHPWLRVYDPLDKKDTYIPPSGSIAGIYARSDNSKGVHKAPANEIVNNCTGLSVNYNTAEQDFLNPKGLNAIRSFPGAGIRVWGARTASSKPLWKYINIRRLFIYIEESIKANTSWVVFEPNDSRLWGRVRGTIETFLGGLWSSGALVGGSPDEAFFVDIGPNTMTRDDIDNGRLICVIGVAPVKPAEFVIFRITQKTAE
jgi:hypothetical protein